MADSQALKIVAAAIALRRSHPNAPALAVLDLALQGHERSDPDFSDGAEPGGDHTELPSAFADLLRRAFAPSVPLPADERALPDFADAWQEVIDRFADRYSLWRGHV